MSNDVERLQLENQKLKWRVDFLERELQAWHAYDPEGWFTFYLDRGHLIRSEDPDELHNKKPIMPKDESGKPKVAG